MGAALLAVLVFASSSLAAGTPVLISGYEATDNAGTGSFEYTAGGTTADVSIATGGKCHDADTDGASSSFRCLKLAFSAGDTASARFNSSDGNPIAMNTDVAVMSRCYLLDAVPSSGYATLGEFVGTDSSRQGWLRVNSDRTVEALYDSTSFGKTAPLYGNTCSSTQYRSCTSPAATYCPSGDSCNTCNATTGAGCYWACIELVQRNFFAVSGDSVQLDMWLNGEHVVQGSPQDASGLASVDDWIDGAVTDTVGTGGATIYIDDARTGDGTDAGTADDARLGWGPVHMVLPDSQLDCTMTDNSCATSAEWSCEDDYASGAVYQSSGTSQTDTARPRNPPDRCTFTTTAPTVADIGGIGTVVIGRTSNDSFTYTISTTMGSCDASVCDYGTPVISDTDSGGTTHILMQQAIFPEGPTGPWDQAQLDALGVRVRYESESSSTPVLRIGAVVAYIAENYPDSTEPTNLPDVNSDGEVWVYAPSDSLGLGTLSVVCKTDGSQACSQTDYCEWDTSHDKPAGGCGGDDTVCRTCSLKRTQTPGGSGYPCDDVTYLCSDSTCDTANGVCNQNANIPCSADADCTGWGTCPTAASSECVPSCPEADGTTDYGTSCTTDADCDSSESCESVHGSLKCVGACPQTGIASWSAAMCGKLGSDVNCVVCPQGGDRTAALATSRWDGLLRGKESTCEAIRGTGLCNCADDGDCTSGACDTGTGTCGSVSCTSTSDCTYPAAGPICVFNPPDVVVVWDETNNANAPIAPECRGLQSNAVQACTEGGNDLTCNDNGDCAAHGADAICYGQSSTAFSPPGLWCASSNSSFCSARPGQSTDATETTFGTCTSDSECTSGICWDGGADPLGYYHLGFCGCTLDSECVDSTNYTCVDADTGTGGVQGICRRNCTGDSDCPDGTSGSCVSGTCLGQCSNPCSKDSCSVDADCPTIIESGDALGWSAVSQGQCVSGACAHCGVSACAEHGAQVRANTDHQNHAEVIRAARVMQQKSRELGTAAPILVWATTPLVGDADNMCGTTHLFNTSLGFSLIKWNYGEMLRYTAERMRRDSGIFPHVVDLQARHPIKESLTQNWHNVLDDVHFTSAGAAWAGGELKNYLDTLDRCATDTPIGLEPQRYCRAPSGTYRSPAETCDVSTDCTNVGDACVTLACTADSDCSTSLCNVATP